MLKIIKQCIKIYYKNVKRVLFSYTKQGNVHKWLNR